MFECCPAFFHPVGMRLFRNSILAFSLLLGAFCLPACGAGSADSPLDSDLKRLQGEWRAEISTDEGTVKLSMKIEDRKMSIAITKLDGEKVGKLAGEFKLAKADRFRSFTYFNLEAIEGPNKGQKLLTGGKTRSSLYRFHDGDFITVSAMDEPEGQEPRMIQWRRAKK